MPEARVQQDVYIQEVDLEPAPRTDSRIKSGPYLRLDTTRNQIRILELSSGRWDDTIRGNLRTISLNVSSQYEALSYTWGGYGEGRTICINGCRRIEITDNLFRALRRLRRRTSKRVLWIDSICIDQSNVEERGQQVSIMGEVYKKAMTVLVWLGEYSGASRTDQWRMRRPHWKRKGYSTIVNVRGHKFAEALNRALCDTEPKWYERAWVIQEFVLARETMLCFGPVSMAYNELHFIDLLMSFPSPIPGVRAFHERTSDMIRLKNGMAESAQSISEAALMTCMSSCSNPKDKVFSLLSLIDSREASAIQTNYKRTCAEVFANATYAAIVAQKTFEILELVCFETHPTPGLPSWVVDFAGVQEPHRGWIHREVRRDTAFQFSTFLEASAACTSPDLKELVVSGVQFDYVAEKFVMPASNGAALGDELTEILMPLLRKTARSLIQKSGASSRLQIQDQDFKPSLLLIGKVLTQVQTVLIAAFTLWTEITALSLGRERHGHRPFWQCDKEEQRARESETSRATMSVSPFLEYAAFVGGHAVVFATQQGSIGIAPASMACGDALVMVRNSELPMIFRQVGDSCSFRGFAYVHGIYDSENMDIWQSQDGQENKHVLH